MSEIEDKLGFNEKPEEKRTKELGDNNAEKIISIFAYVTLVLGCLVSFIYGISLMGHYLTEVLGLVVIIVGVVGSIISWSLLMVVANISNNIRQIKYELKKKNANQE